MDEKKTGKYGKVEEILAKNCLDTEFVVSQKNAEEDLRDFEASIGLIELESGDEEYSWHSDNYLPEYYSLFMAQMSQTAAQNFQTRDYAECYLEDGKPDSVAKAAAAKECINRTLNQRHIQHFQKTMRAEGIRRLHKNVVLRCWWERVDMPAVTGFKSRFVDDVVDVNGFPITDSSIQVPRQKELKEPVVENKPVIDRFNYDVIDPRNVVYSPEYVYSIQDKRYVYVRWEDTLDGLQADAETHGYINLNLLEKVEPPKETETSQKSYNKERKDDTAPLPKGGPFDIIERYGKDWVVVTKSDDITGEPLEAEPGYDEYGKVKKGAVREEMIMAWAVSKDTKVLIRYHLTPYVDVTGRPFRPLLRAMLYVHPTKDGGIGEGKVGRELNSAINDTFNISNDRVQLATMPVLKGNKYALEDNDTIRFEPGHTMEVFNKDDIEEFKIRDDIGGATIQRNSLKSGLQEALAVYAPQLGRTPEESSTTATAIADAGIHANARSSYSSITNEYTMWTELYWMILQMTAKFAHPDTGVKLMGDKVYDFDPNADYIYKPVTQAIETEASKANRVKALTSILGYVVQLQNPRVTALVNKILGRIFEAFGDEYEDFADALLEENGMPLQTPAGGGGSPMEGMAMSNQNGVPQSASELRARGRMLAQ